MKINSKVKIGFLCSCLHVLDLINVELRNTLLFFPLVSKEFLGLFLLAHFLYYENAGGLQK